MQSLHLVITVKRKHEETLGLYALASTLSAI